MQIEECDSILGAMETMLGRFQADLGNVSGEIRSLQARSCLTSCRVCCVLPLPVSNCISVVGSMLWACNAQMALQHEQLQV